MKKRVFVVLCCLSAAMLLKAQSPYISRVYEYRPAPGQFINTMPKYEEGDTEEIMTAKAEAALANHQQEMICLGGWGGYVTFGFDHMIVNVEDEYDLKILGNAFYADSNPKDTSALGGSAEPGIVLVSYDANENGLPDDEWYELAGSEYANPLSRHGYSMTYYRPSAEHEATPDKQNPYLTDTTYIRYCTSEGEWGYMAKNSFHKQDYYPLWLPDSLNFTGTRLRDNAIDESGTGRYYVLYMFDWGYVDNQPNVVEAHPERHASEFKLDWAIDSEGEPVRLPGIHFVRVYTAVHQYAGWLGETSTEIMDAWDMHPEAEYTDVQSAECKVQSVKCMRNGQIVILKNGEQYTILGTKIR